MINEIYRNEETINSMKDHLDKQGVLLLNHFFENKYYKELRDNVERSIWREKHIPDKCKYCFTEMKINLDFLNNFLEKLGINNKDIVIKRFNHRDFTLLHDDEQGKEETEFFLFMCEDWNPEWGGMKVYVDLEGEKQPIVFPPQDNTLCIIKKNEDTAGFFKYVNNKAGKNEFFVFEGK